MRSKILLSQFLFPPTLGGLEGREEMGLKYGKC